MKKETKKVIGMVLVSAVMFSACSNKQNTYGTTATALGVMSGLLLGKNTEDRVKYATGLGILFGIAGSWIGKNLDKQDQEDLARKAQELANSNGSSSTWQSSTNSGTTAKLNIVKEYTTSVEEPLPYEEVNSPMVMEEIVEESEPMVMNNVNLGEQISSSTNRTRSTRQATVKKKRVSRSSESKVRTKRVTRESKPKTKRDTRERTVMVKRKCKDVSIAIKLPNGKRGTETVKTCQDKNGLYGV